MFAPASCLRVKTAALNHSAISPELVVCSKARVARRYGGFVPGIPGSGPGQGLPSTPSGPATASLSASASPDQVRGRLCLRVKLLLP